jgi:hypothetical protein
MKKITLLFFIFCVFNISAQTGKKKPVLFGKEISSDKVSPTGHIRCATDEYNAWLNENNPKRMTNEEFEAWLAPLVENYKNGGQSNFSESGGIITIPVVVHVIHNGDAYGVNENITDEQVMSQITVMNQDFRRMVGTPGYNTNPVGVDTNIQFALAKADVNGNPTNGINRVNLCQDSWSTTDINGTVKPATSWNPSFYMNMWSVKFTDGSLLGYAQFPDASGLGGLNPSGGAANTDGVVSNYTYFGSRTIYPAGNYGTGTEYDKGRTMTHEVGHWIGLRHIWGDGNCGADDFCADTPAAGSSNFGCPAGTDSCPAAGVDMIENYMDYSDDSCMNIFTADQKARMVVIMNNASRRVTLKASTKDLPIALFANDAEVIIENGCAASTIATCANPNPSNPLKVISLYNRGTSNLTSATINYNMNGTTNYTHNFTGNLAPNSLVYITLPNTNVSGTLNTTVVNANGAADQRASNNVASKAFGSGSSTLTDYPYSNFNYTLVKDNWGSETTWDLKNSAGTILYSGGPYTGSGTGEGTTVENLNWTLAPDCYTFTINDTAEDGICCGFGTGSYSITTNAGATTVAAGGEFTRVETVSFTNASLSSSTFNLESISMYPNPTKNILNIEIPVSLGVSRDYQIFNNLGQVVKSAETSSSNFSINTSEFSNGVYFLKLNLEGVTKTLRFIKN